MKETKGIAKSIVWSYTYVNKIPPKLEYSFNGLFKLFRFTTVTQYFKSTEFLVTSLKTQCLFHLSLTVKIC